MCSERTWQLLQMLSDGKFHSGEDLAEKLGVSRASVFNSLKETEDFGIELQRIRGRGYRLARPWDRLKKEEVQRWLRAEQADFDIEILQQASSSNTLLMRRAASGAASGSILAIELQTAGRGRLGRIWRSGLGTGLTYSMLWRFDSGINALSGLSLAVGVGLVRALDRLGAHGVRLKWPNDLMTENGKLGGVLVEAQGDMLGPSAVVIGIGMNYALPESLTGQIDQPVSSLSEICEVMPSRSQLLAAMIQELAKVLRAFAKEGFAPMREEWQQYHANQGREIQLRMPDGTKITGMAIGVSDIGELLMNNEQGNHRFNSGEVGAM
jgi:BirA family biotin operon repressor/biotin-[acetyl-CoA-carboxylase] ligase